MFVFIQSWSGQVWNLVHIFPLHLVEEIFDQPRQLAQAQEQDIGEEEELIASEVSHHAGMSRRAGTFVGGSEQWTLYSSRAAGFTAPCEVDQIRKLPKILQLHHIVCDV